MSIHHVRIIPRLRVHQPFPVQSVNRVRPNTNQRKSICRRLETVYQRFTVIHRPNVINIVTISKVPLVNVKGPSGIRHIVCRHVLTTRTVTMHMPTPHATGTMKTPIEGGSIGLDLGHKCNSNSHQTITSKYVTVQRFRLVEHVTTFPVQRIGRDLTKIMIIAKRPCTPRRFVRYPLTKVHVGLIISLRLIRAVHIRQHVTTDAKRHSVHMASVNVHHVMVTSNVHATHSGRTRHTNSNRRTRQGRSAYAAPLRSRRGSGRARRRTCYKGPCNTRTRSTASIRIVFPGRHRGNDREGRKRSRCTRRRGQTNQFTTNKKAQHHDHSEVKRYVLTHESTVCQRHHETTYKVVQPLPHLQGEL